MPKPRPHMLLANLARPGAQELARQFPDSLSASADELEDIFETALAAFAKDDLVTLLGGAAKSRESERLKGMTTIALGNVLAQRGRPQDLTGPIIDAIREKAHALAVTLQERCSLPQLDVARMTNEVQSKLYIRNNLKSPPDIIDPTTGETVRISLEQDVADAVRYRMLDRLEISPPGGPSALLPIRMHMEQTLELVAHDGDKAMAAGYIAKTMDIIDELYDRLLPVS